VEAISIIEELEVSDEVKRFALNVESAFFTMFMKETLKG
jgi:hypothetical protein